MIWTVIWWLGAIAFAKFLFSYIYSWLFLKINLNNYSHGSVCITGGAEGIGKAIAYEFLLRNFKVILIDLDKQKLELCCTELKERSKNPNLFYVVKDFSYSHRDPEAFYLDLYEELKPYNISVLVNNVGVGARKFFTDHSLEKMESIIGVNIYTQVFLTKSMLKDFLDRYTQSGQKSLLINISSGTAHFYGPMAGLYAPSKSYIKSFSNSLAYELKPAVDVAVVLPGMVNTSLLKLMNMTKGVFVVDPEVFAKSLLRNLSIGENNGHWKHFLFNLFVFSVPYFLSARVFRHFFKFTMATLAGSYEPSQ